jgi:rhodanese-related sulfurtransferase
MLIAGDGRSPRPGPEEVAMEPTRWTVEDVAERIDRGERPVFVDTRNPQAWAESDVKLPGALRIPLDEIDSRRGEIPRGRAVVTYCT